MIEIEQRLARLERSCRRWRIGCIALAMAIVGACAAAKSASNSSGPPKLPAAKATAPDLSKAQLTVAGLTVRDPAGGPALSILADHNRAAVYISSADGGSSATLVAGAEGSNLILTRLGHGGATSASIGADDISGAVALRNAAGKTRDLEP